MTSTFLGITISASGLAAAQMGQNVVGNNIANAATPGYSSESVDLQQNASLYPPNMNGGSLPGGQIGTGVNSSSITRAASVYLDAQVRSANSEVGAQTAQNTALQQIEQAYGEPSSTGLNAALANFYQSFNAVATSPEDLGARASAVQDGVAVANSFQTISSQLGQINKQLTAQTTNDMSAINADGAQIAALNVSIRSSLAAGQQPNSLLDQRGTILDKLSSLANINVLNNSDGTVNVSVGTSDLVVGANSNALTLSGLQSRGDLQGGDLAGAASAQATLQANITGFNDLAAAVASQVNAVHASGAGLDGTTGLNFFNVTPGSEASSISVNAALVNNPSELAAAAVPSGGGAPPPGDGSNATALANLQTQNISSGPLSGETALGSYQQTISTLGSQAATAQSGVTAATATQTQLNQQRSSVTGVSTDQQLALMLEYQNAYQANAKVLTTMSTMLGSLISAV